MAGLLTTEASAESQQLFQHKLVANVCANEPYSFRLKSEFEADVAHYRCHNGVMIQLLASAQIPGEHPKGSVAIYQSPSSVDEQSSIGITIESDTELCALLDEPMTALG